VVRRKVDEQRALFDSLHLIGVLPSKIIKGERANLDCLSSKVQAESAVRRKDNSFGHAKNGFTKSMGSLQKARKFGYGCLKAWLQRRREKRSKR